jgi:hypothetical protein
MVVLNLSASLSPPSWAAEDAILDAVRSGKVTLDTEVVVPPARAPATGDASPSFEAPNRLTGITVSQQRLIVDKLFPLAEAKWPFNLTFVCWENPTDENKQGRLWVQDAVQNSWAKYSGIQFFSTNPASAEWQKCESNTSGIHIVVNEEGPHTVGLGKFLDGVNDGMVLNFTFTSWSQSCQSTKEFCIRAIAVHEFGHAIGFAHEQNRPDAPGECMQLRQGSDGNKLDLTPYDPKSVMNYCNPYWNNSGNLSDLDIKGVQSFYGMPR